MKEPWQRGSVFKRKDKTRADKPWVARCPSKDEHGDFHYRDYYCASESEAQRKLHEAREQLRRGLPVSRRRTVETLLVHWLEHEVQRNSGYGTWKTYADRAKHIIPTLGQVRLEQLEPEQVDRLLTLKEKQGLAQSHVKLIHKVLRLALRYAMRYWGLDRNVAALVNYNPRALVREQRVESFTIEQARHFADAMKGDAYKDALIVALNTGMREGEVLGLTWDNVLWDEDPLLIRVKWQLARREHPTWQLDLPKTKKSERDVAMNPLVFDILSQRRDQGTTGSVPVPIWNTDRTVDNLVFTNGKGRPINPQTLRDHFKAALTAAELPELDIHDLRHTFTSLCLDYGVPLEVLSDVLGHGSIRQTKDTYGHLARKTLSQAPDAIHTVLNGGACAKKSEPTEEMMERLLGKGKVAERPI